MPDPISFTSASPRHALALLFAGQTQKEFFFNDTVARIDALLHPAVEGVDSAPPSSPAAGESWLVGGTPTGAWADHAGELACFTAGAWIFLEPREGMQVLDSSTGGFVLYRDGTWSAATAPAAPTGGTTVDAEARTAITGLIAALADAGIFAA